MEFPPYIIDTGNNGETLADRSISYNAGRLGRTGQFHHAGPAANSGAFPPEQKMDVVVYAHGGTGQRAGRREITASTWIGLLKDQQIFPIFFMWESGIIEDDRRRKSRMCWDSQTDPPEGRWMASIAGGAIASRGRARRG